MKSIMMPLRTVRFIWLVLVLILAGCGYFESKEDLAAWVKLSMQTEIRGDKAYQGIDVVDVVLIREKFNKYTGYIEFRYGDNTQKVNVTVTVDGSQKLYECAPPRSLIMMREEQLLKARLQEETRLLEARGRLEEMEATKNSWIKETSEQLSIIPEKDLMRYAAPLWDKAKQLAREAESLKTAPIEAKCKYEEALRVFREANELVKKEKMTLPATFKIDCTAPDFKIFEKNALLISSNQQFSVAPFKEHILKVCAEGFKPTTLTIKAAKPEEDLGVKRIVLLRVPPGGDSNAVSWKVISEQWIENTYENGDITMSDRHSGNMWVYESARSGKRDWDSAVEYCNKLNYAGYSDWRLPERENLHEIYKQKRSFSGVQDNSYWSSTFNASDSECAWGVCMIDDCTGNVSKRGLFYAWPVRSFK